MVAEGPTYPGAVPSFIAYEADVVQIEMDERRHADRRARGDAGRLEPRAARPKFIYTIPNFQNPAGVTMSLERRRRRWSRSPTSASSLILEDNPYGLLRYEGDPLPTLLSLDGGRYVIYLGHVLEDPLRRGSGSGWAVAPRPDPREA